VFEGYFKLSIPLSEYVLIVNFYEDPFLLTKLSF
jgi:hypothetical protein